MTFDKFINDDYSHRIKSALEMLWNKNKAANFKKRKIVDSLKTLAEALQGYEDLNRETNFAVWELECAFNEENITDIGGNTNINNVELIYSKVKN
jgi:hypothetical protein